MCNVLFVSQTETVWRDEDIVDLIEEMGDTIALVFLSGVWCLLCVIYCFVNIAVWRRCALCHGLFLWYKSHYWSRPQEGELFLPACDLCGSISEVCRVAMLDGTWHMLQEMWSWPYMTGGWTLLAGVPIRSAYNPLTLWFQSVLNNQYLNAGPGSIGGFFVHEKHGMKPELTRWEFGRIKNVVLMEYRILDCWAGGLTTETPGSKWTMVSALYCTYMTYQWWFLSFQCWICSLGLKGFSCLTHRSWSAAAYWPACRCLNRRPCRSLCASHGYWQAILSYWWRVVWWLVMLLLRGKVRGEHCPVVSYYVSPPSQVLKLRLWHPGTLNVGETSYLYASPIAMSLPSVIIWKPVQLWWVLMGGKYIRCLYRSFL